jgi:hypothetical protein
VLSTSTKGISGDQAGVKVLSFPKIPSVRIRAMRQNQRIIRRDARIPSAAWDLCRQPVQVATSA